MTVLDAVDRLRGAAGDQHRVSRMVRLGTVNTATVPLLIPTVREFRSAHPATQVEVVGAQQADVQHGLLEGAFDLGLVNHLRGDDIPPGFDTTELLRGRPVACVRPDSPPGGPGRDGCGQPPGRTPHRDAVRLCHASLRPPAPARQGPSFSYSTDGTEMGKLMVAEGLRATVLPDFSVIGDPLERRGTITVRPLAEDGTDVLLVLQHRHAVSPGRA
ncbi:DNA-binding transcriptional LysR family regulator [Streptomyces luteogriseus]|uniref:LysR family transcriptional regulator substrate-binding protein n=1 Tax=Streptomyces luteogriseus TaxID=68233 RepID=UPI002787ADE7|nr:LysR family transcriptional regulator substrate-binding protein [Streptomyces luteogriseus]MDQ0718671.1 DNA-binding transcriptional LysR family regulator [Streptomyces luteogriseus]